MCFEGVTKDTDVDLLNAQDPDHTCHESCPHCDNEVVIPAYRVSRCPICGEYILPCSMCSQCTAPDCPYYKSDNYKYLSIISQEQVKKMRNTIYELRDNYETIIESKDFDEIKETLVEHTITNTYDGDKCDAIDSVYDPIEISEQEFRASRIVEELGDLDEAFKNIICMEYDFIEAPEVGDSVELNQYGFYTITARMDIEYALVLVTIEDAHPVVDYETYTDEADFYSKIVELVKDGWLMGSHIHKDDELYKVCLVKID